MVEISPSGSDGVVWGKLPRHLSSHALLNNWRLGYFKRSSAARLVIPGATGPISLNTLVDTISLSRTLG